MSKKEILLQSLLRYGLISGIFAALIVSLKSYLIFGPTLATFLPLGLAGIFMLFYVLFRKTGKVRTIAMLSLVALFGELILKEQFTPVGEEILFWFLLMPIIVFSIFSPLYGAVLSALFFLILLFIYHDAIFNIDPEYYFFSFYAAYFVIAVIMFIYRNIQIRHEKTIQRQSQDLRELNRALESRIKDAVAKSREQQKLLHQQSRLAQMGEMISMIAHQWRQPLAAISAVTIGIHTKIALGKYGLESDEERRKFLNYLDEKIRAIETHVQTLSHTIDDFRTLYRPDSLPQYTLPQQPIEKALSILQSALQSQNIDVEKRYLATRQIPMHGNQIMQVALNLIKNSIDNFIEKSTPSPIITISTRDIDNGVQLLFCDNGGGIDAALMEKIFDPYFSTKDEKNGTGLGLYMSKMLIEEHHHGTIVAANTPEGVCFEISLFAPQTEK